MAGPAVISAPGGIVTKRRILAVEGVELAEPKQPCAARGCRRGA
jgi:hypothetical protein